VSDKTRYPTAATKRIASLLLAVTTILTRRQRSANPTSNSSARFSYAYFDCPGGWSSRINGKSTSLAKRVKKSHENPEDRWNKWLKTTLLDELRRIEVIKGQTGKVSED